MSIQEYCFPDEERLVSSLVEEIEDVLVEAIEERGKASLVVPGGKTPKPLFNMLADLSLPWPKISIVLTDERWVPLSSESSNEGMLRGLTMNRKISQARFVSLRSGISSLQSAQSICDARIETMPRPFDFVILGMGVDGHIASLFPRDAKINNSLSSDGYSQLVSSQLLEYSRISLSAETLLNSRRIGMYIRGKEKWNTYQHALKEGEVTDLPVRLILQQYDVPVSVYWSA